MSEDKNVRDDLSYVRGALARAEGEARSPASVYFLWAAVSFFGFAIIDFAPHRAGVYWLIAGPLGGVLSGILGERAARRAGRSSLSEGRRWALHWAALLAAILLLAPLAATGGVHVAALPRLILLVSALVYFLAGVHLDRRMIAMGPVLAGCYLLTVAARGMPYLWTLTAAVLAASLVLTGLLASAPTTGSVEPEP